MSLLLALAGGTQYSAFGLPGAYEFFGQYAQANYVPNNTPVWKDTHDGFAKRKKKPKEISESIKEVIEFPSDEVVREVAKELSPEKKQAVLKALKTEKIQPVQQVTKAPKVAFVDVQDDDEEAILMLL